MYRYDDLFIYSGLILLLAMIFALFHGLSSNDNKKISEKMYEFGRNAFIQLSAMLFALALAQMSLSKTLERQNDIDSKVREEKSKSAEANERSAANAVAAARATDIQRAMRRFDFRSAPQITPPCLSNSQKNEYEVIFNFY